MGKLLFQFKRLTVGTLVHSRVEFVGTNGNAVKRAVVLILAMVCALLDSTFDALVCVGSTFLYNYTNEDAGSTLTNFRKHLKDGGILYLDMRNAAFFLTKEGQRWLTDELLEEAIFDGKPAIVKTRFYIDLAKQILKRDYNWKIGTREAIIEHLEHRLFFPQEIAGLLSANGFEVVELFDKPEPHISSFTDIRPFQFGYELSGRRLQVIAKAI